MKQVNIEAKKKKKQTKQSINNKKINKKYFFPITVFS